MSPLAPEDFPSEVEGRGVVIAIERGATIEIDGCCTFNVQRIPMPPLFELGEVLDVRLGYAAGFVDSDWGLTLLDETGALRLFAYSGGFTRARFEALEAPVDIELNDVCGGGGGEEDEDSCYIGSFASSATVTAGQERLTLVSRERGLLQIGDGVYQVLNSASARIGVATGNCTDNLPPGEFLGLQIIPNTIEL